MINSLQAIGAIAGGASSAVTQGLSNTTEATNLATAVAIFQGPFITGVTNIFPDHTIEHINHINDLGFSASSNNKTIAPIQGAVPLVTFLSEKPLEQLPFAHCGKDAKKGLLHIGDATKSAQIDSNPGASQYQFCRVDDYDQYGNPYNRSFIDDPQPEYYMKPFPFRKWDGAALDILKRRTFVVIGGVHTKETPSQPTITSVSCPPKNDSTIDLANVSDPKNVSCTLKGNNLDLIAQVELQNAQDANDKTTVQGSASISGGDTTQATIVFLKDDLAKLKGANYKLFYSLKGGGPQQSSIAISLKQPISLNPSSLDFGDQAEKTKSQAKSVVVTNNTNGSLTLSVSLTGTNPKEFTIESDTCMSTPPKSLDAGGNCTITLTFAPDGTGQRSATVSISDSAPGSPQTVTLTGNGTTSQQNPAPAGAPAASTKPSGATH